MKITLAATVIALTVLGVVLARTSPGPSLSGQSGVGHVDALPSGGLRAASGAPAAPPDNRVAPLQQLVLQSEQENEQLGRIDNQLT
ncbi:MAG TPA: hypothetical protein VIH41_03920, partial [Myxococcales bacterium]